jgi:tetratricopeptide (TPR) repeat protein
MIKLRHIFKLCLTLTLLITAGAPAYGGTLPDINSASNINSAGILEATTEDKSAAGKPVDSGDIDPKSNIEPASKPEDGVAHSIDPIINANKDMQEALVNYRTAIKELDENGPYHEQSSEALYGLGIALKKQGFYDEALNTLKRAMHVNRVNHGLHSFSQTPILRSIIDTQKALHHFEEVTTDYNRLLRLFQKNYASNDPALIPVYQELALWHVDVYQLDSSAERVDHLTSAHSYINAAIKKAQAPNQLTTQEKIELLRTSTLISFYSSQHKGDEWVTALDSRFSASSDKDFMVPTRMATLSKTSYRQGRLAHEQIIALVNADPTATIHQKISAYVETGDWHLLFKHHNTAMEYYQQARILIAQTDMPQELNELWFSQPIILPSLRAEGGSGNSARQYVSAQVDISKNGHPSHINILEPTPEKNVMLHRAAIKTLRNARFRPRFVGAEAVNSPAALIKMPLIR